MSVDNILGMCIYHKKLNFSWLQSGIKSDFIYRVNGRCEVSVPQIPPSGEEILVTLIQECSARRPKKPRTDLSCAFASDFQVSEIYGNFMKFQLCERVENLKFWSLSSQT